MCCMRTEVAMQHGFHFINKTCIPVARASNFSGYATDVYNYKSMKGNSHVYTVATYIIN